MQNIFTVGVSVALVDNVSAALNKISQTMMIAHGHTDQFQQKLAGVQDKLNKLHALELVGKEMFQGSVSALEAMAEPAKEYAHHVNRMNMLGLEQKDIALGIGAAWENTNKVIGSTATENLKTILELNSILQNMPEAVHLSEKMGKAQLILTAASEKYGVKNSEGLGFSMLKSIEMMGKLDPKQIEHHIEMMTKVMQATSGKVLPTDYQQVLKYANQAKVMLDDNYLYRVLPEMIIENKTPGGGGGASRQGTAIAAMFRQFAMGTMNKVTAANMDALGLLQSNTMVPTTTTGTITSGVIHKDEFVQNPQKWIMDYFVPALEKAYPEAKGNPLALSMKALETLRGNQLSVGQVQEFITKDSYINADTGRFGKTLDKVPGFEQSAQLAQQSPTNAMKALDAAYENLRTVFGMEIIPILIPGLQALAAGFREVTGFFKNNPWAAELVVALTGAIALVGGIVMIGAAIASTAIIASLVGFSASVGTIAASIGGAIVAFTGLILTVMHWDEWSKNLQKIWESCMSFLTQRLQELARFVIHTFVDIGRTFGIIDDKTAKAYSNDADRSISQFNTQSVLNPVFEALLRRSPVGPFIEAGKQANQVINPTKEPAKPQAQNNKIVIAPGAVQVKQQPGEDSEVFIKRMMDELTKRLQEALKTQGPGFGSSESAWLNFS